MLKKVVLLIILIALIFLASKFLIKSTSQNQPLAIPIPTRDVVHTTPTQAPKTEQQFFQKNAGQSATPTDVRRSY